MQNDLMLLPLGAQVCVYERRIRPVVPNPGGNCWHRTRSPRAAGDVAASDKQWLDTYGKVSATMPPGQVTTLNQSNL